MARPLKNNAEYFSHDADMRNDIKVMALRRRFSHKGYAVWCFFLEVLTDAECFEIIYDEVSQELLAADFGVTVEDLVEIVDYCQKIGLLQISSENMIYSEAHHRRFASLIEKRKNDRERLAKLREGSETESDNGSQEEVIATRTSDKEPKTCDNSHSKVKENTAKETKIEKTLKVSYEKIVADWNSVCLSLPKVLKVTDERKTKIRCRVEEFGVKPEELEDYLMRLFQRVQASDFLTGRYNGKVGWIASFDWLFENPSNWVKVTEGNYDNDRGGVKQPTTASDGSQAQLGVGEFIDPSGRRTYGSGRATIPMEAPPRPSERYSWDEASKTWIML